MEQFKVGDRVIHVDDGDTGVITSADEYIYEVEFENDGPTWVNDFELRLISGNSEDAMKNRADHFAELAQVADQLGISSFESNVRRHTDRIAKILVEKNKAYGDSALNPVRIFSKADRTEQLYTRIDDKISRIQKGTDFANEDTIDDLIGYLFLLKIARESN